MGTERGTDVPPTTAGFVDRLRGALQAHRETEENPSDFGIFAVSLGGMVALNWLSRFPQDFTRAVIVNTSAGDLSSPFERFHPRNYGQILRAVVAGAEAREQTILQITSNRQDPEIGEIARRHAGYAREHPTPVRVFRDQIRAAIRSQTPSRLEVPTLFLASTADRLVDASCSSRIAERLGQEIRLHDAAGHDLPLDAPEWIMESVSDWMKSRTANVQGQTAQIPEPTGTL